MIDLNTYSDHIDVEVKNNGNSELQPIFPLRMNQMEVKDYLYSLYSNIYLTTTFIILRSKFT